MTDFLLAGPTLIFYASFWLLIEYQRIGKELANDNPFETIPAISNFPGWLEMMTLLLSNMYITLVAIIGLLILSFFTSPWYFPILAFAIAYALGLILFKTGILVSILGYRIVAVIGPAWILGFGYFVYFVLKLS